MEPRFGMNGVPRSIYHGSQKTSVEPMWSFVKYKELKTWKVQAWKIHTSITFVVSQCIIFCARKNIHLLFIYSILNSHENNVFWKISNPRSYVLFPTLSKSPTTSPNVENDVRITWFPESPGRFASTTISPLSITPSLFAFLHKTKWISKRNVCQDTQRHI